MAVVSKVFLCIQAVQTWTVPTGVTSATFEAWGAPGGADYRVDGYSFPYADLSKVANAAAAAVPGGWLGGTRVGSGPVGYVKGTLAVTPGALYNVFVGGAGQNGISSNYKASSAFIGGPTPGVAAAGGYNGGGAGGLGYTHLGNNGQYVGGGSGGGGASDVRLTGVALSDRVLVAGGAGGAGGNWGSRNAVGGTGASPLLPVTFLNNPLVAPYSTTLVNSYFSGGAGMAGYGGGGGAAERGTNTAVTALASGVAAQPGTSAAGGAAGTNTETSGVNGSAGASGVGGAGGNAAGSTAFCVHGGGGGGGGYYGGGGGGTGHQADTTASWGCGGGGAGGSNYVGGSFTDTFNVAHLWPDTISGSTQAGSTSVGSIPGGAVRITYVQPPTTPTWAMPAVQTADANSAFTVKWVWSSLAASDVPNLLDGGAEIVYTYLGVDTTLVVPPQTTTAANGRTLSYAIPAGTLVSGRNYTLKIRTYDQFGSVSPYSSLMFLRTIDPLVPATITAPTAGANLSPSSFNVTWTNPNTTGSELLYRVTVESHAPNGAPHTGAQRKFLDSGIKNSTTRLNLIADAPMKVFIPGWNATGGTKNTDTTVDPWGSANCYKVTWASTSPPRSFTSSTPARTVPGWTYTFSGYFASTASTDPGMAMSAIDGTTNATIATGSTVAVAGTPGNWQRCSVTFTATSEQTYLAFTPIGGSTLGPSFFSSAMAEVGPTLAPYFGSNTSKDPAMGTIGFNTDSQAIYQAASDVLSHTFTSWGIGSEYVTVTVYISGYDGYEFFAARQREAKVNTSPPGAPSAVITPYDQLGGIQFEVQADDNPNFTVNMDIFRSDPLVVDENNFPIETHLGRFELEPSRDAIWYDYTACSGVTYTYRIRSNSLAGGFADLT